MEINKKENYLLKIKKYIAVFMTVLMIMSTMGSSFAFAAEYDAEELGELITWGDCGLDEDWEDDDNVTWGLYENGTVIFSGEGMMRNYHSSWLYAGIDIKKAVFEEGITRIGSGAFHYCDTLESVEFPETLESIRYDAFWECDSLTSVYIPADVTFISESAFAYCNSIEEFIVDEDNDVFYTDEYGCLYALYWDDSSCYGDENGFYTELLYVPAGSDMTEYTVPAGTDYVSYYAFNGCYNLEKITFEGKDTEYWGSFWNVNSDLEVVGHIGTSVYFNALECGVKFTEINGLTVKSIEMTKLPYKLEYCVDGWLDCTGMEVTATLSDGSSFTLNDGNYSYNWDYDLSKVGETKVTFWCLDKEFTFNVTVYDKRQLVPGTEIAFNSYASTSEYFYFTPDKTDEYVVTFTHDSNSDTYIDLYEYYEETWYDDWDEEWYTDYWWDWIDESYAGYGNDNVWKVELEAGKEYRFRAYRYADWDSDEPYAPVSATFKLVRYCAHKNTKAHGQQNPTCTAAGYTAGTYCEDCKTWTKGHVTIDPLGHTEDAGVITKAPSCGAAGTKTYSCILCRATTKTEPVAATGKHTEDAGTVTKAATYDAEGVMTYKCTVCNTVTRTASIAKLVKAETKKPAKVTAKKVKSNKKKQAVVTWKKVAGVNGYQVAYSTTKKFAKKTTKTKLVKKAKTTKLTLKKLKSGKKYFVKVRAYKTVNGKKVFGAYSKVKTVKVK